MALALGVEIRVSMCTSTSWGVYSCVHMHVWRSVVNFGCHPQESSTLLFETGPFTRTWGSLIRLVWLCFPSAGITTTHNTSSFYMWVLGIELYYHVSIASALPTEPLYQSSISSSLWIVPCLLTYNFVLDFRVPVPHWTAQTPQFRLSECVSTLLYLVSSKYPTTFANSFSCTDVRQASGLALSAGLCLHVLPFPLADMTSMRGDKVPGLSIETAASLS